MIKKAIIVLSTSVLFIILLNFLKSKNITGFFLEKNKDYISNPSFEETRQEDYVLLSEVIK